MAAKNIVEVIQEALLNIMSQVKIFRFVCDYVNIKNHIITFFLFLTKLIFIIEAQNLLDQVFLYDLNIVEFMMQENIKSMLSLSFSQNSII